MSGILGWLFDTYEHSRARRLAGENRELRRRVLAGGTVDSARMIGELCLVVKAMKSVMIEKGIVTEDELLARMAKVDEEDGERDGRAPSAS